MKARVIQFPENATEKLHIRMVGDNSRYKFIRNNDPT